MKSELCARCPASMICLTHEESRLRVTWIKCQVCFKERLQLAFDVGEGDVVPWSRRSKPRRNTVRVFECVDWRCPLRMSSGLGTYKREVEVCGSCRKQNRRIFP